MRIFNKSHILKSLLVGLTLFSCKPSVTSTKKGSATGGANASCTPAAGIIGSSTPTKLALSDLSCNNVYASSASSSPSTVGTNEIKSSTCDQLQLAGSDDPTSHDTSLAFMMWKACSATDSNVCSNNGQWSIEPDFAAENITDMPKGNVIVSVRYCAYKSSISDDTSNAPNSCAGITNQPCVCQDAKPFPLKNNGNPTSANLEYRIAASRVRIAKKALLKIASDYTQMSKAYVASDQFKKDLASDPVAAQAGLNVANMKDSQVFSIVDNYGETLKELVPVMVSSSTGTDTNTTLALADTSSNTSDCQPGSGAGDNTTADSSLSFPSDGVGSDPSTSVTSDSDTTTITSTGTGISTATGSNTSTSIASSGTTTTTGTSTNGGANNKAIFLGIGIPMMLIGVAIMATYGYDTYSRVTTGKQANLYSELAKKAAGKLPPVTVASKYAKANKDFNRAVKRMKDLIADDSGKSKEALQADFDAAQKEAAGALERVKQPAVAAYAGADTSKIPPLELEKTLTPYKDVVFMDDGKVGAKTADIEIDGMKISKGGVLRGDMKFLKAPPAVSTELAKFEEFHTQLASAKDAAAYKQVYDEYETAKADFEKKYRKSPALDARDPMYRDAATDFTNKHKAVADYDVKTHPLEKPIKAPIAEIDESGRKPAKGKLGAIKGMLIGTAVTGLGALITAGAAGAGPFGLALADTGSGSSSYRKTMAAYETALSKQVDAYHAAQANLQSVELKTYFNDSNAQQ